MPEVLRPTFEAILSRYETARRKEAFLKSNNVWQSFDRLATSLRDLPGIRDAGRLIVRWSVGRGRWAAVPWVAIMDTRDTTKPTQGVYVVFLFRADASGVYLTLNQGVSYAGQPHLRRCAAVLRRHSLSLKERGFVVERGIDLRSSLGLARSYVDSTVAFKFYERGKVPDDPALESDLHSALAAYQKLVPSKRILLSARKLDSQSSKTGSSPVGFTKGTTTMTKMILVCLLCSGCVVSTTAPDSEAVDQTPDDSYEPVAGGGESTYRPNCVPDMAYTIGGKLVVVPGYCHPGDRDLRPIDPDPFEEGFKDPLTDPSGVLGLK